MSHQTSAVDTSAKLIELVYELLDAHDDTARLMRDPLDDARWPDHLDYLQCLQRVGRETLATAAAGSAAS